MSKINDLIKELCLNGVEYKSLDKLVSITTGKLNANAMNEDGKYAFFTCDATPFRINTYAFDGEAILISGNGSQVGHLNYYVGKFNAYQRTYVLMDFSNKIISKYLFHYLNAYLKKYIDLNSKKGSVPYITLPMLTTFKVPIPPLKVQNEIVKILDKFVELEAELEAELEIRKKQYNFWNSKIMKYDINNMKLASVCLNITDGSHNPPKETYDSNYYPMISAKNVINGKINFDEGFRKISQEDFIIENKRTKCEIGDILLTIVGAIGRCAIIESDLKILFQRSICILKPNKNIINSKYLKYIIESSKIQDKIISSANGAAQKGIYLNQINNLLIPVPSLEEQEKIVNILDRFDKLINENILAEIELRRKQYEYYRNKLLNFEELTNE